MRQVEVVESNAGHRYPPPRESGTSNIWDPRRLGKAVPSMPPAKALSISLSVKYGRRTLSGSGKRQQTSHWRQVRLGTSCGSPVGSVTDAPICHWYVSTLQGVTRSEAHTNTNL